MANPSCPRKHPGSLFIHAEKMAWIPACAGMTEWKPDGSDILLLKQQIFRYYEQC